MAWLVVLAVGGWDGSRFRPVLLAEPRGQGTPERGVFRSEAVGLAVSAARCGREPEEYVAARAHATSDQPAIDLRLRPRQGLPPARVAVPLAGQLAQEAVPVDLELAPRQAERIIFFDPQEHV